MKKEEMVQKLKDSGEVITKQFGYFIKIEESSESCFNCDIFDSPDMEDEDIVDGGVFEGDAEEAVDFFLEQAKDLSCN